MNILENFKSIILILEKLQYLQKNLDRIKNEITKNLKWKYIPF
jgi:hypothetical protein